MGWGAINAALNGLVRTGVITAFKTNLAQPTAPFGLHVIVAAEGAEDAAQAEAVLRSARARLQALEQAPRGDEPE